MCPEGCTDDALLGGRVRLWQPATGYRAATDPVLLAAAVPAKAGDHVLDLGCGVGAASLCLGARVWDVRLHGLELQPDYLSLAEANASRNGMVFAAFPGDVAAPPPALRQLSFDHVMMNPPWYDAAHSTPATDPGRDTAHRMEGLSSWLDCGLARLKPGGWLTVIQRSEKVPEMLAAIAGRAGDVALLPISARSSRPAKRVILAARKGSRGPFRLLAPIVMHEGPAHLSDQDDFTAAARAILRDAAPISLREASS